ncbi:MAG TPA: dihydrofolate reductase family protein [Ornithinibacter sp.]|nr:dihydrofolate reductase family protein [Ornithinibacter sp.]
MLVASVTVSLDGYLAGPGISREQPMGEGGARLHEWIMDPTPTDLELISETLAAVGAVVLGRRTFDVGRAHWNDDTPYPAPSFVVTHRPHDEIPTASASFVFVPDLLDAVDRARTAAGKKQVMLMGADVTQQALDAGLVDELRLQVAPFLLGSGTRLFTGKEQRTFECLDARVTSHVTHLRFRSVAPVDPPPR